MYFTLDEAVAEGFVHLGGDDGRVWLAGSEETGVEHAERLKNVRFRIRGKILPGDFFNDKGKRNHAEVAVDVRGTGFVFEIRAKDGIDDALAGGEAHLVEGPKRRHTTGVREQGWDTKTLDGYSSAGRYFGPNSFGHTGFTGTSIWIDPDQQLFVILLTNRVYPSRENRGHITVRPAVADLAYQAIVGEPVLVTPREKKR